MELSCCWLYAIFKYGFPPAIKDVFKAVEEISQMGYKNFELEAINEKNLRELLENKKALKDTMDNSGVKVINFCPLFRDVFSPNEKAREKAFKLTEKSAELASYFGSNMIQTDTFTPPIEFIGEVPYKEAIKYGRQIKVEIPKSFNWQKYWKFFSGNVKRLNEIAKDNSLKFCVEPRVGEVINNTDSLLRLFDEVNDDNFGAILDTAHLHAQKEIIPLSIEKLGKKIFYVHAADNDSRTNEHLAPGKGTIDWDATFKGLRKFGFNGYVAIDVGVAENLIEEYNISKKFLEKYL
ncbi:MAG: sugar phosphate isomerase/epimerase [Candidatus Thermoplasmatota archaeon]|nr:sugar phosphate isomerase/epimerase [Candidatus Thermoplasmatota archaeon]